MAPRIVKWPAAPRWLCLAAGLLLAWTGNALGEEVRHYVGAAVCGECHDREFENFAKYAKKFRSYESVATMEAGLTDEE